MNPAVKNLESTTFFGRRFTRKQVEQIQRTVELFSKLSRRELAHTICEHFSWFTPAGSNRIQTSLSTLEKLESLGILTLPKKIVKSTKKHRQKKIEITSQTNEEPNISCLLKELTPIFLEPAVEKEQRQLWNEYIERYHYLGCRRPIGTHLRYFIIDKQGRKLGCLLFSFATRNLACRDQWIGWSKKHEQRHLHLVINNNRFLIFPWVKVNNLASKVLSIIARQISADWMTHHHYRPVLIETFVDPERYKGTCYKAANWKEIGRSSRGSQKIVYVYPLMLNFRDVLSDINHWHHRTKRREEAFTMIKAKHAPNDDLFVDMWQKIIAIVIKVSDDFDRQWRKRQRVITTLLVILFIFRLVFSKNKQGYVITVNELWDQCRKMSIKLSQEKPIAASSFCEARLKINEEVFKILNSEIISVHHKDHKKHYWKNHRIFAVDGSKINLPRKLSEIGYRTPTDNSYYPQGLLSCLYQLKSKIPTDFSLAAHGDERALAISHLDVLMENDVVVYDRGYFSYAMLCEHFSRKIAVIFRLQTSTFKIIQEFFSSDRIDDEVIIELKNPEKKKMLLKYPQITYKPLRFRLVKYIKNNTTYLLGTTLFDKEKYTIENLSDAYFSRWGIEELYKISKNLIDVEDFHAQTERGVKQELFAHFVLITLSRIFTNHHDADLNTSEKNTEVKANFKNSLITVARNLEGLFFQQANLIKKTVKIIINSIGRCHQKVRINRSYKRVSRRPLSKWRLDKTKRISIKEKTVTA